MERHCPNCDAVQVARSCPECGQDNRADWLTTGSIVGEAVHDAFGLETIRDFIGRNLDVLLYLSLPVFALVLRLAFRRSGRNLAEVLWP